MLQMMMRFQPRVEIENEAICSWVLDAQYISNFREIMQRKSLPQYSDHIERLL